MTSKTSDQTEALIGLLTELEQQLREAGLWSESPPEPEAMNNIQPFAYDSLTLPQWLQWIFIPRVRALMDANTALPENCNIHSYAEEWFRREGIEAAAVLNTISSLDRLLGGPAQSRPSEPAAGIQ